MLGYAIGALAVVLLGVAASRESARTPLVNGDGYAPPPQPGPQQGQPTYYPTAPPPIQNTIPATNPAELLNVSCKDALAILPTFLPPAQVTALTAAIANGTNTAKMRDLARQLRIGVADMNRPVAERAALRKIAACFEDRAALIDAAGTGT